MPIERSKHRRNRATRRLAAILGLSACAAIAGCSTSSKTPPRKMASAQTKEYFSEKAYGVKASPRVSTRKSGLRRGGGREQIGKPYKVKGRWYTPKEEPGYSKTGKASWYGAAFHGRLTANGEVYDMTHLTAAHPTMPLPSYARVTNMKNGSSVIVRVNDRGPFAHDRIIDLSKRAAEMLDYTHDGTATVRVDYVGRAPLDGQDDEYLMASYQPAGGRSGPMVPQPSSDVLIAMNGATPLGGTRTPAEMALAMTASGAPAPDTSVPDGDVLVAPDPGDTLILPVNGPILGFRPFAGGMASSEPHGGSAVLSYADIRIERANRADDAFGALVRDLDAEQVKAAARPAAADASWQVLVGTFDGDTALQAAIAATGERHERVIEYAGDGQATLLLTAHSAADADALMQKAWSAGYTDAFRLESAQ